MKIDFVKTLAASGPYVPGTVYFEETTSLIKVATETNKYRVFGGVRSAEYDSSTNTLTIQNGNGEEVYLYMSEYVKQDDIPSTLDQIADGSTRKLADYLPLGGGTMNDDASINLRTVDNDDYVYTTIQGNFIKLVTNNEVYGSANIFIDGYSGYISIGEGTENPYSYPCTRYGDGYIRKIVGTGIDNSHRILIPSKSGTFALTSDIPTDASVSGWGYLKANDVSTKVDKTDAIKSLSLDMNSSTYVLTLSGTMADGSTFTVGNPVDLPLETMVIDGSYNSATKQIVLGLKSGSTIEFSVADLVSGLQSEITSSNKLSADLIQDGTTNKVVTATDKNKWNNLVSNVQADWNATSGLAQILNKPTIPTDASVAAWGYIKTISDASIAALGYTKNTGTLTGVKFNNAAATINGTVAEITADIPPAVTESTVSGWGFTKNAAANDATITIQKNGTTVDSFTVDASSNKTINMQVNELPAVTASDNGKILRVVNGAWAADTAVTVYSGSSEPSSSQGINGDIYIQS